MKSRTTEMKIINPNAAGIDVGSRSHFVAIGQQLDEVKEFGVYSIDHAKMISYLKQHQVRTIAMESTGSYWQTLFSVLQKHGFEVLLVSGHQTKNVRGKTDVKDCQWIQKLHSLGLLRSCFLPSEQTAKLRVLSRHRSFLVEQSSKMSNKMQKSLRLMNLRLDVVINDIMGKSGRAIIEAIIEGERNGYKLAQEANSRVKKSKEEIANALQGEWKEELLFELSECFELFKDFQKRIEKCDRKMEDLLEAATIDSNHTIEPNKLTKKQVKGKNQPKIPLPRLSYQYYGVDLFAIESVSMNTVLCLISEIGDGIYKFTTAKQFASFLRLAPNNKVSGGKILSSRTPKGKNRFALVLRNAANTISRQKDGVLVSFFRRIAYKKGRAAAITATARKLAVIIWNMVVKKEEYKPMETSFYKELLKQKAIAQIKRKMQKLQIATLEISSS